MKIWRGFGSEHSANIIMIGYFRTVDDASAATEKLTQLCQTVREAFDYDEFYADKMSVYGDAPIPKELERLKLYDMSA
ncbi:MAG: DUF6375 family protein, partial [Chloroflexi bacterium]|nr:DUF6375 family protein [Chloroflexota bacterium]